MAAGLLGSFAEVTPTDLPDAITRKDIDRALEFSGEVIPVRELERRYATWAIWQTGGHRGKTAEKLEIDRKRLRRWLGEAGGDDNGD